VGLQSAYRAKIGTYQNVIPIGDVRAFGEPSAGAVLSYITPVSESESLFSVLRQSADPDAVAAIEALVQQVSAPVRWEAVVRRLASEGVTTYVEVGPGAVLSGLVRKIHRDATVVNLGSPDDLAAVEDALGRARLNGSRFEQASGSRRDAAADSRSSVAPDSRSPRTTS